MIRDKTARKHKRPGKLKHWLGLRGRSKASGMVQKHNQNTYKKKKYEDLYSVMAVKRCGKR